MRPLEDRLEGAAEGWRPEPGDRLIGVVTDISAGHSDYGADYPIVTLELADGSEVAVHAFHTVLRNEIAAKSPQVGDRLGVKYHGERVSKNGSTSFEHYVVAIERAAGNPTPTFESAPASMATSPSPVQHAASRAATETLDPWADKRTASDPRGTGQRLAPGEEPF